MAKKDTYLVLIQGQNLKRYRGRCLTHHAICDRTPTFEDVAYFRIEPDKAVNPEYGHEKA